MLYEHSNVNRQVHDFPVSLYIVVAQHVCQRNIVVFVCHDIRKGVMPLIVFAEFHLYRDDIAVLLYYEFEFALLLAVEIIKVETVRMQFFRDEILKYCTEVYVFIAVQNSQLQAVRILCGK